MIDLESPEANGNAVIMKWDEFQENFSEAHCYNCHM